MEDDCYEEGYEDEEDSEGLVLAMGSDGKAEIRKPEDYVEMLKSEAELIKEFINENTELFKEFMKKKE